MENFRFRAWIKSLEWLVPIERINFDCETIEVDLAYGQGDYYEYDFSEVTVTQWTGLRDKEGTMIFAGDIVATSNSDPAYDLWNESTAGHAVVQPFNPHHGYHFKGKESIWNVDDTDSIYALKFLRVVGNVYENPELVK